MILRRRRRRRHHRRRHDRIIHLAGVLLVLLFMMKKSLDRESGAHYVSRSGRRVIYAGGANCRLSFVRRAK